MKTEAWHKTDCNGNELWVYPVLECDGRYIEIRAIMGDSLATFPLTQMELEELRGMLNAGMEHEEEEE